MIMYFGHHKWIYQHFWLPFRNCQMATEFVSSVWGQLILEEIFWRYMNFKMQSIIHFWAPLLSFGFCVFGCPLTIIAWNLGWVEVIKSLVKGYVFHILQKNWTTLHLEFLRLWLFLTISTWKHLGFFFIQNLKDVIKWTIEQTTIGWTIIRGTTIEWTTIGWSTWPKPLKQVISHII
jgi:hypothetical protein